jgi:hypothetical protein
LVAGVVNLNTRQAPVLEAILAGAYLDEAAVASGTANAAFPQFTGQQAYAMLTTSTANLLERTSSAATGEGPLRNVSELVGRWVPELVATSGTEGAFVGPSGDLTAVYGSVYGNGVPSQTMQNVDRFREAFIRPLAAVANTRVWNLLIDVVAQTGRYPFGATNPASFVVEGEQRYWVHVAIDRYTGQILDKQVEVVKP